MMQAKEVEALITAMVEPLLQDTGLTLVDVEYVREKDWYLRIFLDKPGGVEIDDCQMVSEKADGDSGCRGSYSRQILFGGFFSGH